LWSCGSPFSTHSQPLATCLYRACAASPGPGHAEWRGPGDAVVSNDVSNRRGIPMTKPRSTGIIIRASGPTHSRARPRVSVPIGCQNSNEKRRNRGQSPTPRRPRCGRYAGIERSQGALRVCLPCRRSRVRVPSAASETSPCLSRFCAFQLALSTELGGHHLAMIVSTPRGAPHQRSFRRASACVARMGSE
jgi:hypothetical protein